MSSMLLDGRHGSVNFLTFYVCLLLALPAPLQVAALGSAGSPATILSVLALFWWVWYHFQRVGPSVQAPGPLRQAVLAWMFVALVVYAHAMSQPFVAAEISPADRGMLRVIGAGGILLVACDGILSLEQMRALLRRLVLAVGLLGLLGLLQYVLRDPLVNRISIPGLTDAASVTLEGRSGLSRPSGTSTHPIEYGAVLTLLLPLVVTHALAAGPRRWLYRLAMAAVCFSIFLCISRSAMICALVGLGFLSVTWRWRTRLWASLFGLLIFGVVYVTTPGVLGTIGRLFTGISGDSSVASRTGSYPVAWQFIERRPLLGRGFGTFLPEYWILDNQYLLTLVEMGFVGLVAVLVLIGTALYCVGRACRLLPQGSDHDLAVALMASISAGAAGLAFFDSFSYPQSTGVFFLLLGLAGAYWRLARSGVRDMVPRAAGIVPGPVSGRSDG